MQKIKEQFKSVIRYTQGIEDPQIDELFDRWFAAKKKFIDRFGGFIYEHPVDIEFTLDEKEQQVMAIEFAHTVHETYNNPVLGEFIESNLSSFFENKVTGSCGEKIPIGMKLTKAFKFFEHDTKRLRSIQDEASQILQKNKIKGTLCFSVHPLDFLSSSENTYNWRSCHALDGEFRAGNLSYMIDEVTFMVYLKGADNIILPSFPVDVPWNSKKWRMLIHAHPEDEIIFAGRQYPFSSRSGINTVLSVYNNLFTSNVGRYRKWESNYVDSYLNEDIDSPFGRETNLDTMYLVFNYRLMDIQDIVKHGRYAMNYNDVLQSTCYTHPFYAILNKYTYRDLRTITDNPIVVGGEVRCLMCGQQSIIDPETMRCHDCELEYGTEENSTYGTCDCCGTRMYTDDGVWVGDDLVCSPCFEENCFCCEHCGDYYYNEEKVYFNDGWYCRDCYDVLKDDGDEEEN